MTATTKLALELLQNNAANQTLANTTFAQLNQLVQAAVVDRTNTPPGSPADEALYIITATATGAWAGKENQLAYWLTSTNAWQYILPREGMLIHVNDENVYYKYNGTAWEILATGGSGTIAIEDEGTPEGNADTLNFTGSGVTVTVDTAGVATINIPGGGSSTIATQSASSTAGALDLSATTATVILVTLTENITSITMPAGAANQSIERRIVFTQAVGNYTIPTTTGGWGGITVDGGGAIPPMGTGAGTLGTYVLANDNNAGWRLYLDNSRQSSPYATAGGTANAITLSINHVPSRLTAYAQGDKVRARIGTTNTGATTLAVDGLSVVNVVTVTGAALPAGYIRTDVDTEFTYNGSAWVATRDVEYGSNANGEFWRYADGAQRCTNNNFGAMDASTSLGSVFYNVTAANWTFPAQFIAIPAISGAGRGGRWLGFLNYTTTSIDVRNYSAASSAATNAATLEAEGRWY